MADIALVVAALEVSYPSMARGIERHREGRKIVDAKLKGYEKHARPAKSRRGKRLLAEKLFPMEKPKESEKREGGGKLQGAVGTLSYANASEIPRA